MTIFLTMGGYAVYVWPAYAVSLVVLIALIVSSLKGHARARDAVRRLEAEGGQRGEADK
jgi:heme exporter protein D